MPRRSLRLEGQCPIDAEYSSMPHVTPRDSKGDLNGLDGGSSNGVLGEAVGALKSRNETRCLVNFIAGRFLNKILAKEGIKRHGGKAVKAFLKEFAYPRDEETLDAINPRKLVLRQKQIALRAISVSKEKRDCSLKGRDKKQKE